MNVSLYQAASALNAHARWQEVITENLSSSSIPGYKRQDLSFAAVQAGMMSPTAMAGSQPFSLTRASISTNFQPGELQMTSSKTDVAIEGSGFFAVQMANGSTAYTRDGGFQLNSQGQLTTKQGYPVLGEGGPVQLDLSDSSPITISAKGEISQGTEVRGRIKVVDFDQPQLLTQAGAGYFVAQNPNLVPQEVAEPTIRQGFIEASNAATVSEMANLITVMRGFEANQRVISMQDERMNRAISELGSPK